MGINHRYEEGKFDPFVFALFEGTVAVQNKNTQSLIVPASQLILLFLVRLVRDIQIFDNRQTHPKIASTKVQSLR